MEEVERMPTTLPSPVDRGESRFVAVDAAGRKWAWIDNEMVWVRAEAVAEGGCSTQGGRGVAH